MKGRSQMSNTEDTNFLYVCPECGEEHTAISLELARLEKQARELNEKFQRLCDYISDDIQELEDL